jgi:hypothetical protein
MTPPKITDAHRADVALYGRDVFLNVDRSIALYNRLGRTEGWKAWEWPRRLAALEQRPEQMQMGQT